MTRQAIKSPAIDIDMLTMALQAGDLAEIAFRIA